MWVCTTFHCFLVQRNRFPSLFPQGFHRSTEDGKISKKDRQIFAESLNLTDTQRKLHCLKKLLNLSRWIYLPLKYLNKPWFSHCGACWKRHSWMLCSCYGMCQSLGWCKRGWEAIFSIQMSDTTPSVCSVFLPGVLLLKIWCYPINQNT